MDGSEVGALLKHFFGSAGTADHRAADLVLAYFQSTLSVPLNGLREFSWIIVGFPVRPARMISALIGRPDHPPHYVVLQDDAVERHRQHMERDECQQDHLENVVRLRGLGHIAEPGERTRDGHRGQDRVEGPMRSWHLAGTDGAPAARDCHCCSVPTSGADPCHTCMRAIICAGNAISSALI